MEKHFKWSFGETYERSKRNSNSNNNSNVESTAYLAALNHDEHSWETLNTNSHNKREEIEHKLSERDIVPRTNMNPFMPNNNFSEDIDTFLKPQGTKLTNEK
jgi:hypothetical protein